MSKFNVGDRVVRISDGLTFVPIGYETVVQKKGSALTYFDLDGDEMNFCASKWALKTTSADAPHYTPDSTGKDYLSRCEGTFSREEMIGAYRFTLGKYVDRMGKKTGEPVEKELAKIIDYATRAKAWLERGE